jgi:hypothetical protein
MRAAPLSAGVGGTVSSCPFLNQEPPSTVVDRRNLSSCVV